ncbi:hypothetical protein GCM10025858_12030 [Alicyclobacillus sacchari]|nr:hypothetical protein GCM10025858_12030 [Alicyclobacillus sacchari]
MADMRSLAERCPYVNNAKQQMQRPCQTPAGDSIHLSAVVDRDVEQRLKPIPASHMETL